MVNTISKSTQNVAAAVGAVLFVKVMAGVLYEYRWYFPPNFELSSFLIIRKETFTGFYPWAFYTHLVAGPIAVLGGTWLLWSSKSPRLHYWHRRLGRIQFAVVVLTACSGFIMAQHAYTGAIAAIGFASLAVVTLSSAIAMVWFAINRKMNAHRRWATRCYLLLLSPLILRMVNGIWIVTNLESVLTYRFNAWLSWLVPILIYEVCLRSRLLLSLRAKNATPSQNACSTKPIAAPNEYRGLIR